MIHPKALLEVRPAFVSISLAASVKLVSYLELDLVSYFHITNNNV